MTWSKERKAVTDSDVNSETAQGKPASCIRREIDSKFSYIRGRQLTVPVQCTVQNVVPVNAVWSELYDICDHNSVAGLCSFILYGIMCSVFETCRQ